MSAANSKNVKYIEGVDHLRGFAAFMVVFHHSFWIIRAVREPPLMSWADWEVGVPWWRSLLHETHIAVALFFVVSGFIFTLAGFGRKIHYGKYMRNRALRVLPVLLTFELFGLAMFPQKFTLTGFLAASTFFADMIPFTGEMNLHPVTTAFWTVGVEVQFYVIFPFLLAIMNRDGVKPLVWMIAFMMGLRLLGFLFGISIRDLVYWHLIPGRLDQFLIGMLLARLYMRWKDDPRVEKLGPAGPVLEKGLALFKRFEKLWVILAVASVVAYTTWLNHHGGYPAQTWWKTLTPTIEALVCAFFVIAYLAVVPAFPKLIRKLFAFLGDMSFSTYIIHFLIVAIVAGDITGANAWGGGWFLEWTNWTEMGLSVDADAALNTLLWTYPMAIFFSVLCFNGLEKPFMRLRVRYIEADEADTNKSAKPEPDKPPPDPGDGAPPPSDAVRPLDPAHDTVKLNAPRDGE